VGRKEAKDNPALCAGEKDGSKGTGGKNGIKLPGADVGREGKGKTTGYLPYSMQE